MATRIANVPSESTPSISVQSPFLTVPDAARYARVSRRAIYLAVQSRHLRAAHVQWRGGFRLLFRREWLDRFVDASSRRV